MNIGWPEGIWIAIVILHLLGTAAQDGQPREGKHNFGMTLMATTCGAGLLYWGGFFS